MAVVGWMNELKGLSNWSFYYNSKAGGLNFEPFKRDVLSLRDASTSDLPPSTTPGWFSEGEEGRTGLLGHHAGLGAARSAFSHYFQNI